MNGKSATKWKIHKLDTTAFPDLTGWNVWAPNDYGQIIGTAWNSDGAATNSMTAVLWNLRPDGKGWKLIPLPPSQRYPFTQAYDINDGGEIIGVANSADFSITLPVLWKPLNYKRTKYSQPIELPAPGWVHWLRERGHQRSRRHGRRLLERYGRPARTLEHKGPDLF